jgi:putative peptidoglycan lipid II flippase
MPQQEPDSPSRTSAASLVAIGIFASRIAGFVRQAVVAYFFGVGPHADVIAAAFRGPNVLQNLLGEGTLSAAFIPVYSRMLEAGRERDAGRFAGAIFGLLLAFTAGSALLGWLLAKPIVAVLTPGFVDDAAQVAAGHLAINRFDLAVQGVRVLFPMTGILVLSAWALAILNSHRRFFLPYVAPVVWNVAIIVALFGTTLFLIPESASLARLKSLSPTTLNQLLQAVFYGALLGGALQFVVQLPLVYRLIQGFRLSFSTRVRGVRETLRAFGPVAAGRGAYQISAWIDMILASQLAAGAIGALGYAQMLYVLPVSLFGMSVAASELPELSRLNAAETGAFMARVNASIRQMMFLTVPTCVAYLAFGLPLVRGLFERGRFGFHDSCLIYIVLGGYTLGLLATTASRLLQNAFYALQDTRTPARIAVLRVVIATLVAIPLMVFLDHFAVASFTGTAPPGSPLFFGAAGLSLGATAGAWSELLWLRTVLYRQTHVDLPWRSISAMIGAALLAVLPAALVWWLLSGWSPVLVALLVLGAFAVAYLALAWLFRLSEMDAWAGRVLQHFRI